MLYDPTFQEYEQAQSVSRPIGAKPVHAELALETEL